MVYPLPGAVRHAGPAIGADSDRILAQLGFSATEVAALRRDGVIWTRQQPQAEGDTQG
jgi:crotonobetainyl-CoA:carnitine CoA-transferase CaiB-like acyl-CoA transferase